MPAVDSEFAFELRVCAWAEANWPPGGDRDPAVVVGRQVGTADRRWDTVVVETTRQALARRARFGARELDADLLRVVRHAPPAWTWYREALPEPSFPWRYVRAAVHRAADRDLVETRKRDGRVELRRRWADPDWARRIVAIENKPDLDAAAARDLADQLRRDVAAGLADEVWVATRSTDRSVEPVLLTDRPPEAGVLTVADDLTATVSWRPQSLAVGEPGTYVEARPDDPDRPGAATEVGYRSPAEKATIRRELAERAYGRGWRGYVDTMRPDCRHFQLDRLVAAGLETSACLPHCAVKDRTQTPGECAADCPAFEPEPPAWRQRGWPIEGGPGRRIKRLLAERRARARNR